MRNGQSNFVQTHLVNKLDIFKIQVSSFQKGSREVHGEQDQEGAVHVVVAVAAVGSRQTMKGIVSGEEVPGVAAMVGPEAALNWWWWK
ncbi:hypothetical protein E3N88_06880 [Mikania micrantha]|uniref:Uncharacterized protein n=1 Tax=Mikania micrantha TaxID=192012 RepID=A0A5N6PPX6_9ASTR|nr:hypothetical protein E3N88_06880 [Mikania micrantha]